MMLIEFGNYDRAIRILQIGHVIHYKVTVFVDTNFHGVKLSVQSIWVNIIIMWQIDC